MKQSDSGYRTFIYTYYLLYNGWCQAELLSLKKNKVHPDCPTDWLAGPRTNVHCQSYLLYTQLPPPPNIEYEAT